MIEATLELRKPLIYIGKNTSNVEFKELMLKDNEWAILIELKGLFEVFIKPSTRLQGQLYSTIPNSLFIIYLYNI